MDEAIPRNETETGAADREAALYGAMLQGILMLKK